jgi:hypothetical protein
MEKDNITENQPQSDLCQCKQADQEEAVPKGEVPSVKGGCCGSGGPTNEERNRSASRMILSLCCFVAALYFYMVPSFFTANITDFLRGVLTATFLFAGLVVFQSKPAAKNN